MEISSESRGSLNDEKEEIAQAIPITETKEKEVSELIQAVQAPIKQEVHPEKPDKVVKVIDVF